MTSSPSLRPSSPATAGPHHPPRGSGPAPLAAAATQLEAVWARHAEEVEAAQRLRWRVFAQEMGARLQPPPGTPEQVDADLYDPHCEHLLVRTVETEQAPSEVVGTYRVLTPAAARQVGGLYSDTEFDLVRLARLRPGLAELGRSCTAPDWRQGGVILMLWSALGAFLQRNGLEGVVGCASVSMRDGGRLAANLWQTLKQDHLAPPDLHVRPRLPLPVDELGGGSPAPTPALIKGYLRCGGKVLGPPAWDPDFGTADFPMMMRLADLPALYRKRFVQA